jgi:hypothetical protein
LRARPSASVNRPPGLSIPFRPRGFAPPRRFTPLGARGLVASRCRSWGSSRFSRFRGRAGAFRPPPDAERSSRRGSHPSKDTSRSQPCRVTAVVASVPFRRLRGIAPRPSWQPDAHPCEHAQPPSFLGFVPLQGPSTRDRETLPDRDADRRRTVCRGSAPHPHLAVNRATGVHTSRCRTGGGRHVRLRRSAAEPASGGEAAPRSSPCGRDGPPKRSPWPPARRAAAEAASRAQSSIRGRRAARRPEGRRRNEAVRFPNRMESVALRKGDGADQIPPSVRHPQRQAAAGALRESFRS